MVFGRSLSLIVVTRDEVLRADFPSTSAGAPSFSLRERRGSEIDAVSALSLVAGPGLPRLGKTYVLSTDCWTHTLELPSQALSGLANDDAARTLSFEAESLSGLNAFDVASAWRPLPGSGADRLYWLVQVPLPLREAWQQTVKQWGGQLAGMGHPGGVPLSLSSPTARSWTRVEIWSDSVVRVAYRDGQLQAAQIDEFRGNPSDWPITAQNWNATQSAADARECLLAAGQPAQKVSQITSLPLADDAVLNTWLLAWLGALTSAKPAIPLIQPEVKPISTTTLGIVSTFLTIAAMLACFAHFSWVEASLAQLRAEKERLEEPGKQIANMQQTLGKLQTEITKQRDDTAKLRVKVDMCARILSSQKQRLTKLMQLLVAQLNPGWMLDRIEATNDDITLHGVTTHPQVVTQMASNIAGDLESLGWEMIPAAQTAQYDRADGSLWNFKIVLRDIAEKIEDQATPTNNSAEERARFATSIPTVNSAEVK